MLLMFLWEYKVLYYYKVFVETCFEHFVFINDWDINFNGETAFLLNDNLIDTMVHIHSKPGRIVVFASDISHKACEISTYSLQSNRQRFVFAYHLYYADYKQLHAISN